MQRRHSAQCGGRKYFDKLIQLQWIDSRVSEVFHPAREIFERVDQRLDRRVSVPLSPRESEFAVAQERTGGHIVIIGRRLLRVIWVITVSVIPTVILTVSLSVGLIYRTATVQ